MWKPRTVATSNVNDLIAISRLLQQTAYFFTVYKFDLAKSKIWNLTYRLARTLKTMVRINPTMLAILPRLLSNIVSASLRERFPARLHTHLRSADAGSQATVRFTAPSHLFREKGDPKSLNCAARLDSHNALP